MTQLKPLTRMLMAACCITLIPAAWADTDNEAASAKPKKSKSAARKKDKSKLEFKLDKLRAETGWFLDENAPDSSNYLHGSASLNWQPDRTWEFQLGARLDGYHQTGTPDHSRLRVDYADSYLRWRGEGLRITAGAQTVTWGRTDEFPPSDRLSRVDATRFPLDNLPDRRRAIPALRVEKFFDEIKLDALWVPDFRPAALPAWESAWHPVDRRRGRMLGVAPTADFTYLIQNGSFDEDKSGAGGGGLRVTRTGGSVDWGLSLQRARQSTPYYELNPQLRGTLLAGGGAAAALAAATGPTFTARHPMSTVAAGELEFQGLGATWRLEGAYTYDSPVTTQDLRYLLVPASDLVAGVEFFPGDSETRITLQVANRSMHTSELLIERKNFNVLTGEIDHPFASGRWRANLRVLAGLNHRDNYINPRLIYRGFEPHEIYVGAHFFSGDDRGIGGYHRDHDMVVLGWQAKY